ncbi:22042_t:CDS:2, partial [Racocetra persica]
PALDIRKNPGHETPVPNTPQGYQLLYQRAWSFNPHERPLIGDINNELDELLKNLKNSLIPSMKSQISTKKSHDSFGKRLKNKIFSSANPSNTIHSDNTHHRTGSEPVNQPLPTEIPDIIINKRNSDPPLPDKPPQLDTDQETVIPPVIPKKPPDIYLNYNQSANQSCERYKFEEQQSVTYAIDPIQHKSTPFTRNNFNIKPQYDSAPNLPNLIDQNSLSPHAPSHQHGYFQQGSPNQYGYFQQGSPNQHGYFQQGSPNQHGYFQQGSPYQHGYFQQSDPNQAPPPQNYNLNINQQNSSPLSSSPLNPGPLNSSPLNLKQPPVLPPKIPISNQASNSSNFIHKNVAQTEVIPQSYHGQFEQPTGQNINQNKAQTGFIPHVYSQTHSQAHPQSHSYGRFDQPTGQNMIQNQQNQHQIINQTIQKSPDEMCQELLQKYINEYNGVINFQEPTTCNPCYHVGLEKNCNNIKAAISFLVDNGCDINAIDKSSKRTILANYLIKRYKTENYASIIDLLLEKGADPNIPCGVTLP